MPLVSLISRHDVITRGNVQTLAHTMLSPFLKKESLKHTEISDPSTSMAVVDPTNAICSSDGCSDSSSKVVNKDVSAKTLALPKLPLYLVDESNARIDLSVGEEKAVRLPPSSTLIVVHIDWSQKLLEKYNINSLENLPEVFKSGPVTKKARTEPLSLYTCLEAFLREEPLVPEDMWLVYAFTHYLSLHDIIT